MANIVIDGIHLEVNDGDYILEIARANGIFIPAICYLSKCSPTLACKMCMVEIDGKRSYACNTKAKDGMNILTNTHEILLERRAIMQSYAVNHPLECGVCDKSGECELQDFVHLCGVDSQEFFITPSLKNMDSWAQVKYDPSLCILCERCITTCKDNLGEANLKVVKQDLPQLDSAYWKEKMPKDAFSVWNRVQKGVIGFVGENPCYDCAECASACPVGALGVKSFQYSSNAWELNKVSSTCNLCPSGCKIVYESKVDMYGKHKIYRVSNDFNFNPICAAGRFGYDIYANSRGLDTAVNAIKKADCIFVGGNTTNNEARFLSSLRDKFNIKLVNPMLKRYSDFMNIFGANTAKIEDIASAKVILSLGSAIKYDNPLLRYKINNALKMQKDTCFIYAHPLKDKLISKLSKNVISLHYLPNGEDAVAFAILKALDSTNFMLDSLATTTIQIETTKEIVEEVTESVVAEDGTESTITKERKKQVTALEDREYYSLFESAGIGYDSYMALEQTLHKSKPLIIIGDDVYFHANFALIAEILSVLADKIDVLIIPPSSNANGILQHLSLDSGDKSGFCVGFRSSGDFSIDSVDGDCVVPFFNAVEDSVTNIDYKTLPLKPFSDTAKSDYLAYMANALGVAFEIPHISLSNDFSNDGRDIRGIATTPRWTEKIANITIDNVASDMMYSQRINAYLRDLSAHFYPYTRHSKQFQSKIGVYVSSNKLEAIRTEFAINEGDEITLCSDNHTIKARIYVDYDMDDDFFAISPQIRGACELFGDSRYTEVRIVK